MIGLKRLMANQQSADKQDIEEKPLQQLPEAMSVTAQRSPRPD